MDAAGLRKRVAARGLAEMPCLRLVLLHNTALAEACRTELVQQQRLSASKLRKPELIALLVAHDVSEAVARKGLREVAGVPPDDESAGDSASEPHGSAAGAAPRGKRSRVLSTSGDDSSGSSSEGFDLGAEGQHEHSSDDDSHDDTSTNASQPQQRPTASPIAPIAPSVPPLDDDFELVIEPPVASAPVLKRRYRSPLDALQRVWGFDSFRPGQAEAIARVLDGKDTLFIAATGSGKSLCYQLPSLLLDGITIVISPLVALMKDQMLQLPAPLTGAVLAGNQSAVETAATLRQLRDGVVKVLFLAPERLFTPSFQRLATDAQLMPRVDLVRKCPPIAFCGLIGSRICVGLRG